MAEIDRLLENVEKIEKTLQAPGLNINNFLLPDSEVVKNIISDKNPKMLKEEVDLMVDGINNKETEFINELDNLKNEGDTPFKINEIQKTVEQAKNNFEKIPESSELYTKAKDTKTKIIEKVTQFVRKIKELLKEMVFSSITISQSIVGSIGQIVTPVVLVPSFNVPGMITMLMNVILTLSGIKSKANTIKETFINFKDIKTVCSKKNANKIATILNTLFRILDNSIFSFIEKIDKFIGNATSEVENRVEKENDEVKNITQELIKLNYLPSDSFELVNKKEIQQVEKILERWRVVDRNSEVDAVKRRQSEENDYSFNDVTKNIKKLKNINTELEELTTIKDGSQKENIDIEKIVYDITFSDGTTVKGLDKESIEDYRFKYNIIYSSNTSYKKI